MRLAPWKATFTHASLIYERHFLGGKMARPEEGNASQDPAPVGLDSGIKTRLDNKHTKWYVLSMKIKREHSATKEKLFEAAQALILGKGFAGTTVDDICKASKLTKGSFFHYFNQASWA